MLAAVAPVPRYTLRGLAEAITARLGQFPLTLLQLVFRFSVASVLSS